jgi:hypothetical protein
LLSARSAACLRGFQRQLALRYEHRPEAGIQPALFQPRQVNLAGVGQRIVPDPEIEARSHQHHRRVEMGVQREQPGVDYARPRPG